MLITPCNEIANSFRLILVICCAIEVYFKLSCDIFYNRIKMKLLNVF